MKTLRYISSIVLLSVVTIHLMAGSPNWELIAPKPEVHLKATEAASFKQANYPQRNQPDPCKEYKRKEIAGFVILPVGIGAAIGGSFMVYRGVTNISNNVNAMNAGGQEGPYVPKHDIVLVSAGAAVAIIGFVLVPTGLAMGISGAVRYHKFCGNAHSFYIAPSTQGVGMACTF